MSLWSRVVIGLESGEVLCLRLIVMRCWCAREWRYVAALGMRYVACMLRRYRARFGYAYNWHPEKCSQGQERARSSGTEGVAMSPKTPNLGHDRRRKGKITRNPHAAMIRLEMACSYVKVLLRLI